MNCLPNIFLSCAKMFYNLYLIRMPGQILLNSFHLNAHTSGFRQDTLKLESSSPLDVNTSWRTPSMTIAFIWMVEHKVSTTELNHTSLIRGIRKAKKVNAFVRIESMVRYCKYFTNHEFTTAVTVLARFIQER